MDVVAARMWSEQHPVTGRGNAGARALWLVVRMRAELRVGWSSAPQASAVASPCGFRPVRGGLKATRGSERRTPDLPAQLRLRERVAREAYEVVDLLLKAREPCCGGSGGGPGGCPSAIARR